MPLTEPAGSTSGAQDDQQRAAGWEALAWAERIAPGGWGNASSDAWVERQRCLVFAAVATGRSRGCVHTAGDVDAPVAGPVIEAEDAIEGPVAAAVVAVARVRGVLRCPPCAEPIVASVTTMGHPCDRCGAVAVSAVDRVALVTGSALIVVAQLCGPCRTATVALSGVN
jgi:hypothetical protein